MPNARTSTAATVRYITGGCSAARDSNQAATPISATDDADAMKAREHGEREASERVWYGVRDAAQQPDRSRVHEPPPMVTIWPARDHGRLVGDHDRRLAGGAQRVEQRGLGVGVQTGGGLVEQQEVGAGVQPEQGTRHGDAASLAGRQAFAVVADPSVGGQLGRPCARASASATVASDAPASPSRTLSAIVPLTMPGC